MKKTKITALILTVVLLFATTTAYADNVKIGTVTASALNVRTQPSTQSSVLGLLPYGASVEIHKQVGSWYEISFMEQAAYIFGDYVAIQEEKEQQQIASTREKLLQIAYSYIGVPYVYGGSSPSGFDCSGFVQYVYAQLGYALPRSSNSQAAAGTYVSAAELQPGDIVCFGSAGYIGHVGIYIGNGQFIHSPRTGYTVTIADMNRNYNGPVQYGRRII